MYQKRKLTTQLSNQIINIWRKHKLALCALDTGGGKTFIAIRSVRCLSPDAGMFVITVKRQLDEKHWQESVNDFNTTTHSHLTADFINYDILPTKTAEIIKRIKTLPHPRILILDESHSIKNTTGIRFKIIKKYLYNLFDRVLCLTATPYGNHVDDLALYFILNNIVKSHKAFISYGDVNKYHQLIEYKNNNKIDWERTLYKKLYDPRTHKKLNISFGEKAHQFLKEISVAASTADVMPPTKFFRLRTPLDQAGQYWYNKVKSNYQNNIYEYPMTARIAYNHVLGSYHATKDYALLTLLTKQKAPTIVFFQYIATRDHLLTILHNYHVILIDGKHHPNFAQLHNITDPNTVLLIQYQAGNAAIELPNAHCAIMYELTMSAIQFHQAQGRNRRAFQTDLIRQYLFITPGTIEETTYYKCIAQNINVSATLNKEIINESVTQHTNIETYQPIKHGVQPRSFQQLGFNNIPEPDILPNNDQKPNYNNDWQNALNHQW